MAPTPAYQGTSPAALNYLRFRSGSVAAICCCCGHQSRPATADNTGEPDLWSLPAGWSTASYPPAFKHTDGSVGSTFTCPSCNQRLKAGGRLKLRAYLTSTTANAA